jgi:hypothetical protein
MGVSKNKETNDILRILNETKSIEESGSLQRQCIIEQINRGIVRSIDGRMAKGNTFWTPSLHWDSDWLRNEYEVNQRSSGEIAAEMGVTSAAILFWLKKHGIERRTISQTRAVKHWGATGESNPMYGKTGAQNPRYVDGSSPERQRLYAHGIGRAFIREALARDNYKCCKCGECKTGKNHYTYIILNRGLEIQTLDLICKM